MKKMSLQWRLTCITTLCIAIICGCLTMFVYKNGVKYILVYQRISGMSSQMIFLFKCTIIKKTTEKTV